MHQLSDYDYDLPENRIAQHPAGDRKKSRLLALDRETGAISHHGFHEIMAMLSPGDVLVLNDTRVIPARLSGRKSTGGKAEVLLVDYAGGRKESLPDSEMFECLCLVRASGKPGIGTGIFFREDLRARIEDSHGEGIYTVAFKSPGRFEDALAKQGNVPLPPYIQRNEKEKEAPGDRNGYQTVYAARNGAVAAPTAGLHFTRDLLSAIRAKGVEICTITLHVSYGTFMPVRENDIRNHRMHAERYHVDASTAETINAARQRGGNIVAVGTTSVRTLEYLADETGRISSGSGMCDLFIYPGYRFAAVDRMITNFHLPKSTLILLVSAFAGKESVLRAYQTAIQEKYRFYSYGDAMFIG